MEQPYIITGQDSSKALVGGRQWENVKTVFFTTPSGVHDSVELPDRLYTAENVHDAIMGKVIEIERVQGLPGTIDPPRGDYSA